MEQFWKIIQGGFQTLKNILLVDRDVIILKTIKRGRMGHGAVIVGDKTFVIGGKTENNQ